MAKIHAFKAELPDLSKIEDTEIFFSTCKEDYPLFVQNHLFNNFDAACLYIYQQDHEQLSYTGLLCALDLEDYLQGKVVPHEFTLAAKRRHMKNLMDARQAHIKPTLLTYPENPRLHDLLVASKTLSRKMLEVNYQEVVHHLWQIEDPEMIAEFYEAYDREISRTYIADGHHRTEVALEQYLADKEKGEGENSRYFLCALFSSDQLEISEFNRIVLLEDDEDPEEVLYQFNKFFHVEKALSRFSPDKKHHFGLYLGKDWYRLVLKEEFEKSEDYSILLDVNIVNHYVLNSILGILNVRDNIRVSYVQGPKGIENFEQKVDKTPNAIGITLFPISFEDFITVVDSGIMLPPKSTWFEPRMCNGIITQPF